MLSQTAAQGRAGTPAPTTGLGRLRSICRRAYRHTRYAAKAGSIIPTFPIVQGKGRRGRRPLRWVVNGRFSNQTSPSEAARYRRTGDGAPYEVGGKRTFQQPAIRAVVHVTYRNFVHVAQIGPSKNTLKTPVRMCESDEIASCVSALKYFAPHNVEKAARFGYRAANAI